MRLELDLNEDEMAVVADALNLHREHMERDDWDWRNGCVNWLIVQEDVERKLKDAGLVGRLDGLELRRRSI